MPSNLANPMGGDHSMATAEWFVVATLTWLKRDVATIARLPVEAHT